MYYHLKEAGLAIENLQVLDANGTVTVTGVAQDGETATKVNELLIAKGVADCYNNTSGVNEQSVFDLLINTLLSIIF